MSGTVVCQPSNEAFVRGEAGLLSRDLSIAEATNGEYDSYVIRSSPDMSLPSDWTGENDSFFMGFVVAGSIEIEFDSIGRKKLALHDVVESHNGERRRIIACSDDVEFFILTSKTLKVNKPRSATIQRYEDEPYRPVTDYSIDGQRDHVLYRDLGIAEATGGVIGANMAKVIKEAVKNDDGEKVRKSHIHILDLHLLFVTGDWGDFHFEDIGVHRLGKGTMLYLPPLMPHAEVDRIVGLEGIEITAPAIYPTEIVEEEADSPYAPA